ncbi:hypothetical protein CBR_g39001 [Chara braunii]|uniref:Reverse transcriptase/retrotransposon-derived protein RNase H-like domain-containing protein n=1 Tax=Chara braunii TaxID=69332 RepID=A0A388K0X0_CHABU|nr:hypothetical protein CBR_g39001 [Chara braunii]|eukprot:GBG63689.1 hypothetical protein CBR_g39001 [Chara braunii]
MLTKRSDFIELAGVIYHTEFKPWMTRAELRDWRKLVDQDTFWVVAVGVPLDEMVFIHVHVERAISKIVKRHLPEADESDPKLVNLRFDIEPSNRDCMKYKIWIQTHQGDVLEVRLANADTEWCGRCPVMDQRPGEADEAYQARMLAWSTETKKQADDAVAAAKKKAEDAEQARLLAIEQQRQHDEAGARAADEERHQYAGLPIERQGQTGKLSTTETDSTTLSTPSEPVSSRVIGLHSEAHAEVDSPFLLLSFEDYAARLVPTVGTQAQGQEVCAVSSPSDNGDISSSSGSSRDLAREFNIEALDSLTSEDFAWLPLPTTGRLPGPQCATLSGHLHTYLSFYAPPTSPTDDEVAVGDILAYTTKVDCEFRTQRYDDNNAPLIYIRIQVGQASCSALLDNGASRNFMSQSFMQRAGLGAQVQRKANPTAIKLADGKTQQLLDRYIEAVPVYFAPHACEPVTFDILDMDFDIILGMPWLASADHTINFHRRTLSIRDAFDAEVACTIPLPHPSIRCQVVTAKSFRVTCTYERPEEIGLCFLRTVVVAESSPTDLPSDPRVVRLLDEFADIFESSTGVVSDRPISHEIILEAGAVPPKGCIYRMSEEELEVLRAQLNDLLAKGWIRPRSSPYGAPVIQEWSEPRNVTDVRSFLGLAGYYQCFIKGYSKIAAHLNKLQCEDRPFDFGEEARGSFFTLKAALLSAEVLRIYDPLLPTHVTTDASGYDIGAVLEQHDGVDWHRVEYFSKKVSIVHFIDDARKKELLAFVHALKQWRHFLLGRSQFRWVIDNNPLVFYKTQDTLNSTIARWMAFVDQFNFFPDHIPGKSNHFADALSRRPNHCTAVYSTFKIDDDLRNSFIRGYQADPEFRDKYANCSFPNPAPSHYRIQ